MLQQHILEFNSYAHKNKMNILHNDFERFFSAGRRAAISRYSFTNLSTADRYSPNIILPELEIDGYLSKWNDIKGSVYFRPIKWRSNTEKYYDQLISMLDIAGIKNLDQIPGQNLDDNQNNLNSPNNPNNFIRFCYQLLLKICRIIKDNPSGNTFLLMQIAFYLGVIDGICPIKESSDFYKSRYISALYPFYMQNSLRIVDGYVDPDPVRGSFFFFSDDLSKTPDIDFWRDDFDNLISYGRYSNRHIYFSPDESLEIIKKSNISHGPIIWRSGAENFYNEFIKLCRIDYDDVEIYPPFIFLLELCKIVSDNPSPTYNLLMIIAYFIGCIESEFRKEDERRLFIFINSWERQNILSLFSDKVRRFYSDNHLYHIETYVDLN